MPPLVATHQVAVKETAWLGLDPSFGCELALLRTFTSIEGAQDRLKGEMVRIMPTATHVVCFLLLDHSHAWL